VRGFFKVSVLAMIMNNLRHLAFNHLNPSLPLSTRTLFGLQLAIAYPLFLYCNFSGYIDIVIGLARLMRLRLPENFNRPFSSTSFIEFWNRWHITLSAWLKNYVYNPLLWKLMLRGWPEAIEPFLGVFSFFVTFFLVGLWHGRTSEFLFFGVLQGSGVAVNKLWQLTMEHYLGPERFAVLSKNGLYLALSRGLTFSWFSFTLFWFWGSWKQLHSIYSCLSPAEWALLWISLWLLAMVVLSFWEWLRSLLLSIRSAEGPVLTSCYARVVYASAMGFLALVVTVLLNQAAPDIVYKAF
jgi:D-alanyl-lipoteichoic acid acyltransferase DltB (MBOAT superfamily)